MAQRSFDRIAGPGWLRPPGARRERDFLAACIRCGQCVQACPHGSLHSAPLAAGLAHAAPFVDARATPCRLCEGLDELRCIGACPTGALEPVADLADIDMGVAILDRDRCLAWNGTVCRACWHACPYPNAAIRLDWRTRPTVDAEACIGCGLCTHVCLTEETSIPIRPRSRFVPGSPTWVGGEA